MTPEEHLLAAADLLASGPGWCQGALRDDDGRYCAEEAIFQTFSLQPFGEWNSYRAAQALLEDEIAIQLGEGAKVFVHFWNDLPDQTAENVIATMRRAASRAASRAVSA